RPPGRHHGLSPRTQAEEQRPFPSPPAHRLRPRHDHPRRLPRPRRLQIESVACFHFVPPASCRRLPCSGGSSDPFFVLAGLLDPSLCSGGSLDPCRFLP